MMTSEGVDAIVKLAAPQEEHLDPVVHDRFILAYALVAGGAHRQLRMLRS